MQDVSDVSWRESQESPVAECRDQFPVALAKPLGADSGELGPDVGVNPVSGAGATAINSRKRAAEISLPLGGEITATGAPLRVVSIASPPATPLSTSEKLLAASVAVIRVTTTSFPDKSDRSHGYCSPSARDVWRPAVKDAHRAAREQRRHGSSALSLVVIASLKDHEVIVEGAVDESVLIGDSSRPRSGDRVLEWLRFPDSRCRVAQRIINEPVDPLQDRVIGLLPAAVVVPALASEDKPHPRSSGCSANSPRSAASAASSKRRAFAGERNR